MVAVYPPHHLQHAIHDADVLVDDKLPAIAYVHEARSAWADGQIVLNRPQRHLAGTGRIEIHLGL